MNQVSTAIPSPRRRWGFNLASLIPGRSSVAPPAVVEQPLTKIGDADGQDQTDAPEVAPEAVSAKIGVAQLSTDGAVALQSTTPSFPAATPEAPSPLSVPPSVPPESSRRRRGQIAAIPDSAAEEIQARLFALLGDASLKSGGFDTDAVLHKLCLHPPHVDDLCRLLAAPFMDGGKKIAAVIGLGGYGAVLAFGVARILPPFPFGEGEFRPVSFLSVDQGVSEKGAVWRLASPKDAATVLRNKRILIVAPVLTKETCTHIQACVRLIEEPTGEGLGVNATVVGVSTLFQLQCSGNLPKGRVKGFETRSVLRLDFQTHSAKAV